MIFEYGNTLFKQYNSFRGDSGGNYGSRHCGKNIHVHVFALVIDNFNIYLNDQESFIV